MDELRKLEAEASKAASRAFGGKQAGRGISASIKKANAKKPPAPKATKPFGPGDVVLFTSYSEKEGRIQKTFKIVSFVEEFFEVLNCIIRTTRTEWQAPGGKTTITTHEVVGLVEGPTDLILKKDVEMGGKRIDGFKYNVRTTSPSPPAAASAPGPGLARFA